MPQLDRTSQDIATGSAVAIGATGGLVGGLLGGGSGVFFVPALDHFGRLSRPVLHGTSTVANIAVCAIGALVYYLAGGAIDVEVGSGLIVGGIVGGFFGAGIIARVPDTILRILFIAIVLLTALKLYLDALGLNPLHDAAALSPELLAVPWFVVAVTVVAGILIGAWAAALGLGGGLLAVPALVLLFGADIHTAAGTSLLMFVPNSIVGGIMHLRKGTASPRLGRLLSVGAVPGAVAGALLALALDAVVLGIVFGTFALAMGIREIAQMTRQRVGG
ncbi:TSUP family transporter [Pseudonocardia phyllosphaerae]|uniref:TSUP family transporter n=1 Tax=Pseudonocardia phyllosphaerae TaxID=3390502 RepID=UPI00397CF5BF